MSQSDAHIPAPPATAAALPDIPLDASLSRRRLAARRMWRLGAGGLGEAATVVFGLAFAWFGALVWLTERGGADLTALVPNAQMWFAEAFEGREAEIGTLRLGVAPEGDRLRLSGRAIVVRDANGEVLETLDMLQADLSLSGAAAGRADLTALRVRGGAVSVVREASGRWIAGVGRPETLGRLGPTVAIQGQGGPARPIPPIRMSDTTLHIRDSLRGIEAQLRDASVSIDAGPVPSGRLSGTLVAGGASAPVSAALDGGGNGGKGGSGRLKLRFDALRPSALAPESGPLVRLAGLDIPLTGEITATRREGGFRNLRANLRLGSGRVRANAAGPVLAVSEGRLNAALDLGTLDHTVDVELFRSDRLSTAGRWTGRARLDEGALVRLSGELALADTRLDAGAIGALDLRTPRAQLDWTPGRLAVPELDVGVARARFVGDAILGLADGLDSLSTDLAMRGELSSAELLSLWPESRVGGARRWVERAVEKATFTGIDLRASLSREEMAAPLPNDALAVDFEVADGTVRYISTMTPLTQARGRGTLRGNALAFTLETGHIGTLDVEAATVTMPRLVPVGAPLTVEARGTGEARAMLELIDQDPFRFASRYGLDPAAFGGRGTVDLTITRPLREFVEPGDVVYAVAGDLTDVSIPFTLGGQTLSGGDIALVADSSGLRLEGPVSFGAWRAHLNYADPLNGPASGDGGGDGDGEPSEATLTGTLSRDALDGFGIGLREFLDGDVPVELRARSRGLDLISADIKADLTGVALSLDPYWAKPYGMASRLTARLTRTDGASRFSDIRLDAPGMELRGEVALRPDRGLESATVERLFVADIMDLRLEVAPDPSRTRFVVDVDAETLDLGPALEVRLREGASGTGGLPLELDARVGRLALAEGYGLVDATLQLRSTADGVERLMLDGRSVGSPSVGDGTGSPVRVRITSVETESADGAPRALSRALSRTLSVELPDASLAARALFGFSGTRDGALSLEATLPPVGESGALFGEVEIENLTLTRAPILAQMLSLASLTGLGDTLSGQGLNFADVDAEFAFRDGRLSLREARASGPALGLTVEGDIELGARQLDLNGVLVPAYTANSLLGGIPLIGDIFVGRKGEGIVSLGYSVTGPYTRAQIAVNPLSALTPGIFREIFNPRREDIEDVIGEDAVESRPPAPPTP